MLMSLCYLSWFQNSLLENSYSKEVFSREIIFGLSPFQWGQCYIFCDCM